MIAPFVKMSPEQAEKIVSEYLQGATVWRLHMSNLPVPRGEILKLLRSKGVMRNSTQNADPSPAEIAERAKRIREGWSEEEAMRRWVGRTTTFYQSSLVGED